MDQQTQVWVKFTSFVNVVVDDVPFVNGSLYIFCAVLLCLYCGSYVFSRKYVEVDCTMYFLCHLVFTPKIPSGNFLTSCSETH